MYEFVQIPSGWRVFWGPDPCADAPADACDDGDMCSVAPAEAPVLLPLRRLNEMPRDRPAA